MQDLLTRAVTELLDKERFYAELILQMNRIVSERVPTAGVCVKDRIELHVNPKFFAALTVPEQVAILKHECQHILNDHISRAKEIAPEVYAKKEESIEGNILSSMKHRTVNVAADCAINSHITNLPKDVMFPETFKLESGQTMEWYLERLKNNEQAKQLMSYDGHELWCESEADKDALKEKIKKAVNGAADRTRGAGKMTGEHELLVSRLNHKPRDWRQDLRRFAARNIETNTDTSRKKRNRRYGVQFPGTVKTEQLHIGVAIDTSGSVSDEALCQFMAEIGNIAKYATVTVVEADSEVKQSYLYDPKKTYSVKGRGGTAYQPAFDFFTNETEVDGVIYFGDMDSSDSPKKPKYPVLWAIIGNQKPPADFGSSTRVEIKNVDH